MPNPPTEDAREPTGTKRPAFGNPANETDLELLPKLPIGRLEGNGFDRALRIIPVAGWIWADLRWQRRAQETIRQVHRILRERSSADNAPCGQQAHSSELETALARIIADEIGWPSDQFHPDDPLQTILWAHRDGLDDTAAIDAIESRFNIAIETSTLNELHEHGTWRDFVVTVDQLRFCGSTAAPSDLP
jgi:hypothetical protein